MFIPILFSLMLSGWGLAGCGPVGPDDSSFEWRERTDDPGRSYLYRQGVQIGGYDHERNVYRPYDDRAGSWGPPQAPPCKVPGERADSIRNFGVDTEKLNGRGDERFRLNGVPASREDVRKALADRRVPDDSTRLRLTVIGDRAATAPVTEDIAHAAALSELKDRLLVQTYAPDHWAVARAGFKTDGRPTIYLQAPDGAVLHRQDDYRDGPEALAQAIRRADPHYDPRKDTDLRQGWLRPHLSLSAIPVPIWLLAAGVLFLFLRRR